MKKTRRYVLLLLLLLPLLLITLVYLQPSLLRLPLEKLVGLGSGLELRINGSFQLEPSLTPRLVAQDIVLSNRGWSRPMLAMVKHLELTVDLLALLSGEHFIPSMHTSGAEIFIEKDAEGNNNWRRRASAGSSRTRGPLLLPYTGNLSLEMIQFEIRLPDQKPQRPLIKSATASLTAAGGVTADLDLLLEGESYKLTVDSDVDSLPQGSTAAFPLHANLKTDNELVRVDGFLGWPLRQADTELNIQLHFDDLSRTAALFAQSIPPLGSFSLKSRLLANEHRTKLEVFSLTLDKSHLTGDIELKAGGVRPRIDALLKADRLPENLVRLFESERGSAKGRDLPLPSLQLLRKLDGEVKLELASLSIEGSSFSEVKLDAGFKDGVLKLRLHPLPLFSGRLESVLTLDTGVEPLVYQLIADADEVKLDKLIRLSSPNGGIEGSVENVQLKVNGVLSEELLQGIDFVEAHLQNLHLALPAEEDKPVMVALSSANLVMNEKKQGLLFTADGKVNSVPMHVTASGALDRQNDFPLKMELVSGNVSLNSSGRINSSTGIPEYRGEIEISAENLQQLGLLVQRKLPPIGPVTARFSLSGNSRQAELKIDAVQIADSSARGTVSVRLLGDKQIVKVDLVADRLQLDEFVSKDNATATAVPQMRERLIPDLPINTSLLKTAVGLELDVEADIKQLLEGEENLGAYLLTLNLKDGVVTLDGKVQSHFLSGVDFHGELSGRGERPTVAFKVEIERLDYGGLLGAFEVSEEVKGELKLELELEGRGDRLPELLANGKGYLRFSGEEGEINYGMLRSWGGTLTELLIPSRISGTEKSIINCMAANYRLGSGKLESEGMIIDTDVAAIGGALSIELPSERLQGGIEPKPKRASLFTLDTPVKIGGTLAQPKLEVISGSTLMTVGKLTVGVTNPVLLVVLFGTMGSSEENPCEAVLSGKTNPVKALTGEKDNNRAGKEIREEDWVAPGD